MPWTCGSVEQELRPPRVAELGPLRAEVVGRRGRARRRPSSFSAALIVQTAYVIVPPGPHALGRGAQQRELKLGQRLAPASAGPAASRGRRGRSTARPRARGRSPSSSAGSSSASAQTTVTFVAPSRAAFSSSSRARPGCFSTATTSPSGSCVAFPPGRGAEVEHPLARPRRRRRRRRAASRGSAARRAALEPVGDGIASHRTGPRPSSAIRDRRVSGGSFCARISASALVGAELAPPGLGHPVGIGVLERRLRRASLRAAPRAASSMPVDEPAHDRVRERRPRARGPAGARARRVSFDGRVRRHRVHEAELVGAEPQRGAHGRVELAHGPPAERLDRVVERAHALHRAVRELHRERAVARVERPPPRRGTPGRRTRPPRRRAGRPRSATGAAAAQRRRPRRYSSAVMRLPPSRLHLEQLDAARDEQRVLARRAARARRAGGGRDEPARADVRRERADVVEDLLRRPRPVELAVGGGDLLGVRRALLRLRDEGRLGEAPRRAARRRASPARSNTAPASSSGPIGKARAARRSGRRRARRVVRWIVTPVSRSPAMIARSTGAAPRQRGSSDGWTFSQSRSLEQLLGDEHAVAGDDDDPAPRRGTRSSRSGCSTGIPSRSAASFAGGAAILRPRPGGRSGRVTRSSISWRSREPLQHGGAERRGRRDGELHALGRQQAAENGLGPELRRAPPAAARASCGR